MLSNIDGVDVITPKKQMAGLVSFNLTGVEPKDVVTLLAERGFIIRSIGDPLCARVSTGFYNTHEEIDDLGRAIEEIKRERT